MKNSSKLTEEEVYYKLDGEGVIAYENFLDEYSPCF